jgi:glycosyltransferase involved in cell wall biosynthesis
MPNALLEAMSFGLPPIVADGTPGPLEVVRDGETGLVVPTGDHRALASAITLLATRPDLQRTLGDAARKEVGRFEAAEALATWTDVLDLRRDPEP